MDAPLSLFVVRRLLLDTTPKECAFSHRDVLTAAGLVAILWRYRNWISSRTNNPQTSPLLTTTPGCESPRLRAGSESHPDFDRQQQWS
jgi:hypothetical protein